MALALTDIINIATFKNTFYYKVGFGIIVNLLKVYIPENTFVEYGFWFSLHNMVWIGEVKVINPG